MADALAHRERDLARADRRLRRATGGLDERSWRGATGRRRINTTADALIVARAIRSRPAAEDSLAARDVVRVVADERVRVARAELAEATRYLRCFGTIGMELAGEAQTSDSSSCA